MFFEQYEVEPNLAVARFWISILGQRDEHAAELEGKWRGGNRALDAIEGHLAANEWLVGGAFSIADISVYAYTHVAEEGGFDLAPYPGYARMDRARRRPARLHPDGGIADPSGALTQAVETVSLAQLRRYVVAHQGYATRFRRARAADVEAAVRRLRCGPARLDLDRRPRAQADADVADRRLPERRRLAAALGRAGLRVLGARGVPRPDRGLAAVQAADGAPPRAPLVGPQARPRPESEEARARRAARARRRCRPGSSKAAEAAACGTGSPRSGSWRTCSPPARSSSPAARASSASMPCPSR